MTDRISIVRAGTPGFNPFRRFDERRLLERQLADMTRGDLAAMMGCSLALQGIVTRYTPTAEQQEIIDRLRELKGANPHADFHAEVRNNG